MKLALILCILSALIMSVAAWTNEEHELFDLVAALEKAEGKGTTFYSWLNISKSATVSEVNKAYRKASLVLHPDKNDGVKNKHERFERLGVIGAILKDPERRKSYDHFYENGVPRWRGTGYYYARWRPGFGTAIFFIALVTSLSQYLIQQITFRAEVGRIRDVQQRARTAAYGKGTKISTLKKRVKIPFFAGEGEEGPQKGRPLLTVEVEGDKTWLVTEDGLEPLDDSAASVPSWRRTWPVAIVRGALNTFLKKKDPLPVQGGVADGEGYTTDGAAKSDEDVKAVGGARKRKGAGKAKR